MAETIIGRFFPQGKIMTKKEWYASEEHFNTEMSYEEYKRRVNNFF